MAKFYFLGNTTPSQMLGCIVKTQNKTVVIDGGVHADGRQIAEFARKYAHSRIDAWFFTHAHYDHIGAFHELRANMPDIRVDKLYHHFPAVETIKRLEPRTPWEMDLWSEMEEWLQEPRAYKMQVGERFCFDDVKITVLRVYNEQIENDFVNNSSAVLRIDGKKSSVLILGDLGVEGGEETMKICSRESLCAEYTQMAHHGQAGANKAFYEYIRPKRCLWSAPDWLWDNDKGEGFDTGPWQTVRTREWVAELGVTEHFISKDGTSVIEI